jgi:hypothetical protein
MKYVLAAVVAAVVGALIVYAFTLNPLPTGNEHVEINPDEFTTNITNEYMPLVPGFQRVYKAVDGDEKSTVIVTVTNRKKQVAGVGVVVVRDTVYENGELHEDTFDYFAQDKKGNVWYFGEDTGVYEDGKLVDTEGSFEAGKNGAEAGIAMPANPTDGDKFRLEYYKEAQDTIEVIDTNDFVEVEAGKYKNVVVTRDTSPLEPNVNEHKFYAKNIGVILSLDISDGAGREELVELRKVPKDMASGPLGKPDPEL